MNRLLGPIHVLWPWLEALKPQQEMEKHERRVRDRAMIEGLRLQRDVQVALDEARRMADVEAERRRGADQKAATYLPLVAALIPLILTIVSALWEKKTDGAPAWLDMLLLGLAVSYAACAGLWAFRVLEVAVSHEAGPGDFAQVWDKPHPTQSLTRRILLYTRLNQDGINKKVTCIKMAHAFLLRAFVTFSLLLIMNIVWYLVATGIRSIGSKDDALLRSPREVMTAVVFMDRLATGLRTVPAWALLDGTCREQGHGRLQIVGGAWTRTTSVPRGLLPAPEHAVGTRAFRLTCGKREIATIQAWSASTNREKDALGSLPAPLDSGRRNAVLAVGFDWSAWMRRGGSITLPSDVASQVSVERGPDGKQTAVVLTIVEAAALRIGEHGSSRS